ncbi:alpha/beta hydrolase [Streptomyces sp. NBC_01476]|uniref:alpha/beta hydrolase n=1 Tax=Streptomyces sp. NBC_01476 TaxID=2903881 RepID=UPI002E2F39B8|nr:alpha/beta hydrolase [Streptomyces sp. NBC_01476]
MGDGGRLVVRRLPPRATAGVLVLPGGREHGLRRPALLDLAALRMRPFVTALAAATRDLPIALAEARYRHRGWNGERADAARDAVAAVGELSRLTGGGPVVLVGHSMGARAALRAAGAWGVNEAAGGAAGAAGRTGGPAVAVGEPAGPQDGAGGGPAGGEPRGPAGAGTVAGVVALGTWWPTGEPVGGLAGVRLVFVHALADRVTAPDESMQAAVQARAAGAQVCRYELAGGDHGMLRHAALWHALTTRTVCALLGLAVTAPEVASAFALPPGSADGLALPAETAVPRVRG